MTKANRAVVLLSGGIDSSTCLALAVDNLGSSNVIALNMFYGQKHDREIESARNVAAYYNVPYFEMDMSCVMEYSDCSLLKHSDKEIEHKSYDEQLRDKEVVDTYVPFRNGVSYRISLTARGKVFHLYHAGHFVPVRVTLGEFAVKRLNHYTALRGLPLGAFGFNNYYNSVRRRALRNSR